MPVQKTRLSLSIIIVLLTMLLSLRDNIISVFGQQPSCTFIADNFRIEVTQGLQGDPRDPNPTDTVPLLGNRSTAVRVYIDTTCNSGRVYAYGYLSAKQGTTTLLNNTRNNNGTPSVPANINDVDRTKEKDSANFDDEGVDFSFHTSLQGNAWTGDVELEARIHSCTPGPNPGSLICVSVPSSIVHKTISLTSRPRMTFGGFRINYTFPTSGGDNRPPVSLVREGAGDAMVQAALPFPDSNSYVLYKELEDLPISRIEEDLGVFAVPEAYVLDLERFFHLWTKRPDYLFGWVPANPFTNENGLAFQNGRVGIGNTEPDIYQGTYAHELGHQFGFEHTDGPTNVALPHVGWDVNKRLANVFAFPHVRANGRAGTNGNSPLFNLMRTANEVQMFNSFTNLRWTPRHIYEGTFNNLDNYGIRKVTPVPAYYITGILPETPGQLGELFSADQMNLTSFSAPSYGDGEIRLLDQNDNIVHIEPFAVKTDSGLFSVVVEATGNERRIQLYRNDQTLQDSIAQSLHSPLGSILSPQQGSVLGSNTLVEWDIADIDGDQLTFDILYSRDGGTSWIPLHTKSNASQLIIEDPDSLPASNNGIIRVQAYDDMNRFTTDVVGLVVGANHPPSVRIQSPSNGELFQFGENVILEGSVYDIEDGESLSAQWTFGPGGIPFGSGPILNVNNLSVGVHMITLMATDSSGSVTYDTSTVTITP